jgi:hypothetical protein
MTVEGAGCRAPRGSSHTAPYLLTGETCNQYGVVDACTHRLRAVPCPDCGEEPAVRMEAFPVRRRPLGAMP